MAGTKPDGTSPTNPTKPPQTSGTAGMSGIFLYKNVSNRALITGIKTSEKKEPNSAKRAAAMKVLTGLLDARGILTMTESIDGLPITEISKNAFSFFERPPGAKEQSSDTLAWAEGLLPPEIKGIRFPATLEKIGIDAFAGCEYIESIVFPANSALREIDNGAFYHSDITGALELPSSLKVIGRTAFYANKKLVSVDLSKTQLTKINDAMFNECFELALVHLPLRITSIGQFSLGNCKKLASITFPAPLTLIDDYAFYACTALTQVDFSALTVKQVKIGSSTDPYILFSNAFKSTGLWGKLNNPDVWVKIPAGKTIDASGGNAGFFAGYYGNPMDTGWNGLTGIVTDAGAKDRTWVKVYAGASRVWPPGP